MALAGILTIQAFLKKEAKEKERAPFFSGKEAPKRIFLGFIALLGFRYLLPVIGFGPSTFFFILFLGKFIGHYSWKVSIFFSLVTAVVAYYLFEVWLKIPMPRTIIGF
jgi:hypothetical protein